jgi:hypothetical protein
MKDLAHADVLPDRDAGLYSVFFGASSDPFFGGIFMKMTNAPRAPRKSVTSTITAMVVASMGSSMGSKKAAPQL